MEFEELRSKAAALGPRGYEDPERVRRDVLEFIAALPPPPLYRRRDDPARGAAAAQLERAAWLLAQVERMGADGAALGEVLAAHVEALCLVTEGRIEQADARWRRGTQLEQGLIARTRLWSRSDEQLPPVFDARTRRSRFDPRSEPTLEATLACPHCQAQKSYRARVAESLVEVACLACHRPFFVYLAVVRSQEVRQLGLGRLHYTFRVAEASGRLARVEFDAPADGQLAAAPRELVAFLYAPRTRLRGVLNLNVGRVLWLPTGCFVATAIYGDGAWQLAVLRRFRDEVLEHSPPGRVLVEGYYRWGPAAAAALRGRPVVNAGVRHALDLFVACLGAWRGRA